MHGEKIDFRYNVNVAATDRFIREILVNTGSQPDPVAIPDLLTAQQEHHDLLPAKLIYDQAAGTGKHHADVAKASGGQTQLWRRSFPTRSAASASALTTLRSRPMARR